MSAASEKSGWSVYILQCADGTLYTGVTNDLARRLAAHTDGMGAKYTRGRGPFALVYKEKCADRGAALKREAAIKALPRARKLTLLLAKPAGTRKISCKI